MSAALHHPWIEWNSPHEVYRVTLQVSDLGWVDFSLDVPPVFQSCSAYPAYPSSALVDLGRQWNSQNQSQPTQGPKPAASPCRTSTEKERDVIVSIVWSNFPEPWSRSGRRKAALSSHSLTHSGGSLAKSRTAYVMENRRSEWGGYLIYSTLILWMLGHKSLKYQIANWNEGLPPSISCKTLIS